MPKKHKRRISNRLFRIIGFLISIGLCLAVLALYVLSRPEINLIGRMGILEIIEAKSLDMRFRLRGERKPGNDIVIIVVDEKTESELGRWQTSGRRWIAQMLDILHEGGAKVIGFDLVLAEADEGAVLEAVDTLRDQYIEKTDKKESGYTEMLAYFDMVKADHDYDRQLAEAIRNTGNVVLGYYLLDTDSPTHLIPEQQETYRQIINRVKYTTIMFPPGTPQQSLRLHHVAGIKPNLSIFSEAASSFGYFTFARDRDGYIRHAPLLVEYMGEYYPSLSLEVVRIFLNPPSSPIIHAVGKEDEGSIAMIQLGDTYIPVDEKGRLFINYYGPERSFPHYSLSNVVLRKIPPKEFADKIVLLGFTGTIYHDVHSVPFQPDTYPGVEVHATIIENIIRKDFLSRAEWTSLIDGLIIMLSGILLGITLPLIRPLRGILITVLCLIVVGSFVCGTFCVLGSWFNMTFPSMFIVLDYLMLTSYNLTIATYRYFTEEKKKKEIKYAFQHYVSPVLVEQIIEAPDKLELGGEERILTALFADIRGFTTLSESITPKDLVNFLNEFFTEMTEITLEYGGTLDKYIGDSIMVFYGAPVAQQDHAVRACKTAIDMIFRLKELRVRWEAYDFPEINLGIGVNSDKMIVGNIGSSKRFNYTIMGDAVNLASRLEGINKQYGTNIVISQTTYDFCQECSGDSWTVRELDTVRVKGRQEPVTIYELFGYGTLYAQKRDLMQKFCEGLGAYKERQWVQAITFFQEALQRAPNDNPSKMYIERCTEYLQNPPPEDWDGVFEMTTK